MKLFMTFALFALAALSVSAVPSVREETSSILEIALASGGEFDDDNSDFDILVQAVTATDLVDTVSGLEDATLFAPTDAAFIQTAKDLGFKGDDEEGAFNAIVAAATGLAEDGDPIPVIKNILLYHVLPAVVKAESVLAEGGFKVATALEDASIAGVGTLELVDLAPKLTNPSVIADLADIEASNGVVHAIDRVLIPVDIAPAMAGCDVEDTVKFRDGTSIATTELIDRSEKCYYMGVANKICAYYKL